MIIEMYWDDLKFQWGQTLTMCQRPRKRREQAFREEAEKKHLTSESWHSHGIQKHTEHIQNTHHISDIRSEVHFQYSSVPFHDHIRDSQLNGLGLHASHTQKEALPHGIQCIYRSHWQFGSHQFWSMAPCGHVWPFGSRIRMPPEEWMPEPQAFYHNDMFRSNFAPDRDLVWKVCCCYSWQGPWNLPVCALILLPSDFRQLTHLTLNGSWLITPCKSSCNVFVYQFSSGVVCIVFQGSCNPCLKSFQNIPDSSSVLTRIGLCLFKICSCSFLASTVAVNTT